MTLVRRLVPGAPARHDVVRTVHPRDPKRYVITLAAPGEFGRMALNSFATTAVFSTLMKTEAGRDTAAIMKVARRRQLSVAVGADAPVVIAKTPWSLISADLGHSASRAMAQASGCRARC